MQGERKKSKLLGWVMIGLGVLMAVRTGGNIYRLWKAGGRVNEAAAAVSLAQTENAKLKKRLAEVENPDFLENEAREKLGLGKEGEVIVIIPDDKSQTTNPPDGRLGLESQETKSNNSDAIWKKWWNLYIKI